MTFAAYPMYEIPENRAAVDAWWHGLAGHLRAAAKTLDGAIPLAGDDPEPALLQALIYDQLGEPALVAHAARLALRVDPDNRMASKLLGELNGSPTRVVDVPIDVDR